MSVLGAVKRANAPGPPEHSLAFRVSATGAVVVSIAACWAQGELSPTVAVVSIALVIVGNAFSYGRRNRPLPWLKLALALAVLGAFTWFLLTVGVHATPGDLASVEGPLAVLFTMIQVTHAFDVPARRDLGFSLAGSATLMAVAAAQAVDDTFALYVVLWLGFGLTGLLAMWGSMAGGARVRPGTVVAATAGVLVVAIAAVAVLPPPKANSHLVLPSSLGGDSELNGPASLVGGANGDEPLHAASPSDATRVGGFLGFAGPLDTAARASLGNEVVMRVRAEVPTFWVAETYDHWNGRGWSKTPTEPGKPLYTKLSVGPPFTIPLPVGDPLPGPTHDLQTFYLAVDGPNLVFHAPDAVQVWFPARRLFVSGDGNIIAGTTMGAGSIYTVDSALTNATPAQLRAPPPAGPHLTLPPGEFRRQTQLPGRGYPRVAALTERLTANIPPNDLYDKVLVLEHWIGTHTRYTTDIPPLRPGQDTVSQFLFGNRRGYCEQISTSLAVMLRTIGVPAQEATGYVPGSYNPLTDLWDVQAKDAHAWVQVWFPGYGWQSFDPTAFVPLANPSPAGVLVHDLAAGLDHIPRVPAGVVLVLVGAVAVLVRWRRRRPATWAAAVTRDLVVAARRAGLTVGAQESLRTVAVRLEERRRAAGIGGSGPGPIELADAAEQYTYGGIDPGPDGQQALRRAARRLRAGARRLRPPRAVGRGSGRRGSGRRGSGGPGVSPGPPTGPPSTTHRQPAGVAGP